MPRPVKKSSRSQYDRLVRKDKPIDTRLCCEPVHSKTGKEKMKNCSADASKSVRVSESIPAQSEPPPTEQYKTSTPAMVPSLIRVYEDRVVHVTILKAKRSTSIIRTIALSVLLASGAALSSASPNESLFSKPILRHQRSPADYVQHDNSRQLLRFFTSTCPPVTEA